MYVSERFIGTLLKKASKIGSKNTSTVAKSLKNPNSAKMIAARAKAAKMTGTTTLGQRVARGTKKAAGKVVKKIKNKLIPATA